LGGVTYSNGLTVSLGATASGGLPVSYTTASTNLVSISSNVVTILGAGTASIVATQNGNSNYLTATPVTNTLVIGKASNTISFPALGSRFYTNGLTIGLGATSSSGLAISYSSVSTNVSISGTNVTVLGAGTASIVASQSGNSNYLAAPPMTNSLVISKPATPTNVPVIYEHGWTGWIGPNENR
jgi:hypothetical protein